LLRIGRGHNQYSGWEATDLVLKVLDIFKFKQFKVAQNQNVHRVGTDGVLLGAWANVEDAQQILDIGTGTGLIALMLAQRSNAQIVAIEPEYEAFALARDNFQGSPFAGRIQIHHTTLQDFHSDVLFDRIICNPPFFEKSLKPPTANRQQQRHTDSLSQAQLLEHANRLFAPGGKLAVVLPTEAGNRFRELAPEQNFYTLKSTAVFSKIGKPQERWLLEFGRIKPEERISEQLNIMDIDGGWTTDYQTLTKEFYLNF
jgi:tRNA1Val (adenine37-N6)-methyltransferase